MKKFEFSAKSRVPNTTFTGPAFYGVYKNAEFLRSSENVETILWKGYELRQSLKKVAPGATIVVDKMELERNTPLLVKNTSGPNVTVEDYEFTFNRLTGLVAVYAYENRHRFPVMRASEAKALGLEWDNGNEMKCKFYLSAVTGTEHHPQFSFFPLVCALRKLQLKKITLEPVLKIAKIKQDEGQSTATLLKNNYELANLLWQLFPGTSDTDLKKLFQDAPPQLKKLFVNN